MQRYSAQDPKLDFPRYFVGPVDDKVYQVHFDDWMYLFDENTMVNRSAMTKFGFELGQVPLFSRRHGA